MGAEIEDLYLLLRAQTAPLIEGFVAAGVAGERMALQITTSVEVVDAQVAAMSGVVRTSMAAVDRSVMLTGAEFTRLQRQTMAATAAMEAATARAAASTTALGTAMAGTAGKSARFITPLFLGAAAFSLIGAGTVKMAGDFERATNLLVVSANETKENLDMVREGMLQMAAEVGSSADHLSDAMLIVERGGYHGADGLKVLQAAAEGAKAENSDLTTVADAVTSALQDYHLKADQAALVTSKFVAAVGSGKTTFEEFSGSLSSVLPIASSAHISLDDISGAIASMTVHGMSARQATQNLADVIKHMVAPTQVQSKELAQLGISSSQLSEMLAERGLTGTLQDLSELIISHMGPSGRVLLNALNQSKDAARNANIMIENMPKSIQGLARSYQQGNITLLEWRKTLKGLPVDQANLLAQYAALQARANGFNDILKSGSPAAQTYQDALRRVTGDATGLNVALMLTGENTEYTNLAVRTVAAATAEAGNHVKGWAEIQETFNQKMSEAKAGLGAVAIQIGEKLLPAVSVLVGWLAEGAQWMAKHQTLSTVLAVALGVLAVGFTIAAVAIWAMNSALLANPITWAVLAIVAAIAVLIWAFYPLYENWDQVWGMIKKSAVAVWHWLVDVWNAVANTTVKVWKNYIVKPIVDAWHWIANFFKAAWHFVADPIVDAWHFISDTSTRVWNGIIGFFRKWWPLLLVIFALPIATVIAIWNHFHDEIASAAKIAWNAVLNFLGMIWGGIVAVAQWAWGLVKDYVIQPSVQLWGWLVAGWGMFSGWLSNQWSQIAAVASFIWGLVREYIIQPIQGAWNSVRVIATGIRGSLAEAFTDAWNTVAGIASRFWQLGRDIVMGIVNGVRNAGGALFSALKGLAEDALSAAKSFLGIKSPSTKFSEQVGRWIPHGIAHGIVSAAGVARDAVTNLARGLLTSGGVSIPVAATSGASALGGLVGAHAEPSIIAATVTAAAASSTAGAGSGGWAVIENHVYIDGRALGPAQVRQAQRHKLRNGSTQMT